jgi:4-amino-4-deoxychorismate lyase
MTSLKLPIKAIMFKEVLAKFKGNTVTENRNRAFMYGESVFTTMRMMNGVIIDWQLHFDRLKKGVEFIYGPFSDDDWIMILRHRLEIRLGEIVGDKVIRLAVYLEQARGLKKISLISVRDLRLDLSIDPYQDLSKEEKKMKLRTCPASHRPNWWPPYLKAGNYLETILCQKMYLRLDDDDLLFLSPENTVLESSVSNIFIIKNNKLSTPPVGPNVLDGVVRSKVLQVAPSLFDEVSEEASTVDQLYCSDAVFCTNSVRGLFLVDRIDDFEITYTDDILSMFRDLRSKVLE